MFREAQDIKFYFSCFLLFIAVLCQILAFTDKSI